MALLKQGECMSRIAFLSHTDLALWLLRRELMTNLKKIGWEVIAIAPEGSYSAKLRRLGLRTVNCRIARKGLNPAREIRSVIEIAGLLRRERPDVLHTFSHKPNIYGCLAARLANVPAVVIAVEGLGALFTEQGMAARALRWILEQLYRVSAGFCDRAVFSNKEDLLFFAGRGIIRKSKSCVIPGVGINTADWLPTKTSRRNGQVNVLMAARLLRSKGVAEFLQAARILRSRLGGSVSFALAGDYDNGNFYPADKELVDAAVKDCTVSFLGWRDDIKEVMASSDIVVLPSYHEGLPMVLVEAASLGKPIVAADVPGSRDVVEQCRNGFLVPARNSATLAAAIERLALDRKLRAKFGAESRKIAVQRFDSKKTAAIYAGLYESLLMQNDSQGL
jgi:N,N'-diacetylbacillosaminyl-diphospho-undecaprenol alpha-1,3-N-acetylgalactosaminyltransferase